MTAIFPMFDIPSIHKRKRAFDDGNDDVISERQMKRRLPTVLPFRSPPQTRPAISVTPPTTSYLQRAADAFHLTYSAPAVEVDDNRFPPADQFWTFGNPHDPSTMLLHQEVQSLPSSPMIQQPSQDNSPICPPMIRSHSGRARSNDLIAPMRIELPELLSLPDPQQHLEQSRIPTPISTNFDYRLMDFPKPARQNYPPARSHLSPMIEQESWVQQQPVLTRGFEGHDPSDAMMTTTDDLMMMSGHDGIGLVDEDTMDTESLNSQKTLVGESSPQHRRCGHERQRSARLHMGFLNGCEKCVQKIPGHYSHILWS